MNEYLEVWNHISKKKKKGWRIAAKGREIEKAFRLGDKIVRWAIYDVETSHPVICFYHTPVSSKLRKNAEKLGSYLHAQQYKNVRNEAWWRVFSLLLSNTACLLQEANTGTMLGPPLRYGDTDRVDMHLEVPPGYEASNLNDMVGKNLRIDVQYLSRLPSPIEHWALIWPSSSASKL